jgi:beta-lactamase regulating signal transducer with metallopeptidase domain
MNSFSLCWFAGAAVCLSVFALRCLLLRRELSRLPDYRDDGAVEAARGAAGVRRTVSVKAAGKNRQAASWGIFRVWILVPDDFAERFSPEERHWIYLHELTHFQRRDPLRSLALALWHACLWFNPLCGWAAGHVRHGFELACDREVVRRHGADPLGYARLIVKTAMLQRGTPAAFSFGFGDIRHRVGQLAGEAEKKSGGRIVLGALAAAAVTLAFAWCFAAAPERGTRTHIARSVLIVGKDGVAREFLHDIEVERGAIGTYTAPAPDTVQETGRWDLLQPSSCLFL